MAFVAACGWLHAAQPQVLPAGAEEQAGPWARVLEHDLARGDGFGTWRIVSGDWVHTPEGMHKRGEARDGLLMLQNPVLQGGVRVTYEARVEERPSDLGLFWGLDDAALKDAAYFGFGSRDNTQTRIRCPWAPEIATNAPVITPGQWHTVRVTRAAGWLSLEIDGQPVLAQRDTRHGYRAPQIGLYAWNEATFRRVTVEQRDDAALAQFLEPSSRGSGSVVPVGQLVAGVKTTKPAPLPRIRHPEGATPRLPHVPAQPGAAVNLIFTGTNDVFDVRGKLEFKANGLERIGKARGLPPIWFPHAVPRPDGSHLVFGFQGDVDQPWKIWRCRTVDGLTYEQAEVVYESRPGKWVGYSTFSYCEKDGAIIAWKMEKAGPSHALLGYISKDSGATWQPVSDKPGFHDHDAFTIRWDNRSGQYVEYQNTMQAWRRKYGDNAGQFTRRVMTIRTSADGVTWTPEQDAGYSPNGPLHPVERLIVPDADDPEDLQFYLFRVFHYADRYVGMMLNYAPSPDVANPAFPASRHGPQLSGEWWVSADGLRWDRPYRDVFAPGEAPMFIWHEPMRIGGKLLWLFDRTLGGEPGATEDEVYGLPEDRLCYVGSLCNAEFTTRAFAMPAAPLSVSAAIGFLGRTGRGWDQGYVMVALTDDDGNTIPGYEAEHCVRRSWPGLGFTPSWDGKTGAELAGRPVALKFYLRDARIHAVRAGD